MLLLRPWLLGQLRCNIDTMSQITTNKEVCKEKAVR